MTQSTERIFYSHVPNLRIVICTAPSVPETFVFAGNALVTSDPLVIEHMEGIANKSGSVVYTKEHEGDAVKNTAADAARAAAEKAFDKVVAAGEASRT